MDIIILTEYVLTAVVIGTQVYFFARTRSKALDLEMLFPDYSPIAQCEIVPPMTGQLTGQRVESTGEVSVPFRKIIVATNSYLEKTASASADIHILGSITNRVAQS